MTLIMQRSLACLVVLSTQGWDEDSVIVVRLLIHGKGRELGDLAHMTTLHVGDVRRLLCCSSGQETLSCRLCTCTPGNCIHTLQIPQCILCVCVSLATQVVQIRQGGVMGQLAQRQHLYNSTHAHMLCLVRVTMMYAETGVAHDPE